MPIYLTLRTADAMRLQDLPGGDGARVAFLTSLGVQMVRCFGFGAWWQSILSGRQGYAGLTTEKAELARDLCGFEAGSDMPLQASVRL